MWGTPESFTLTGLPTLKTMISQNGPTILEVPKTMEEPTMWRFRVSYFTLFLSCVFLSLSPMHTHKCIRCVIDTLGIIKVLERLRLMIFKLILAAEKLLPSGFSLRPPKYERDTSGALVDMSKV